MVNIFALSIRQPWAELIISGKKKMELRSWTTDYRGSIWVHTGLKGNPELERNFGFENLYKGGYLGSVILKDVIQLDRESWNRFRTIHLDAGDFQQGYYGWLLESPRRFPDPIQGSGKLGLFHPEAEVQMLLQRANASI